MEKILEVINLKKIYGELEAVRDVSFSVGKGEIVGLLGPNGAGKTSTIHMVLALLQPSAGSIHIFGKELWANKKEILEKVNFAAVYAQLPGNLWVWQNLYIFARLYGVSNPREKIEWALKEFELEIFRNSRTGFLSSGEQSRLNLAKALLNDPQLLLLDEPTASIDPSTSQIVREKILQYVKETGCGVLWTSHDMREIESVCDRVLFISHGKILLVGNPKTLPKEYGKENLEELFIAVAREPLSLES